MSRKPSAPVEVTEATKVTVQGVEGFFAKVVTKFGTGAKIDCPKRYLGREVFVIIRRGSELKLPASEESLEAARDEVPAAGPGTYWGYTDRTALDTAGRLSSSEDRRAPDQSLLRTERPRSGPEATIRADREKHHRIEGGPLDFRTEADAVRLRFEPAQEDQSRATD